MREIRRWEPLESCQIVSCGQLSLRADLFYLLDYLDDNLVELTKREKAIPTPVVRKLNRLMTRFPPGEDAEADGRWVTFLSQLIRQMGFVSFDDSTRDRYDYESTYYDRRLRRRVRVYREEELALNQARYAQYLNGSDLEKERQITQALCQSLDNELYRFSPLVTSGDHLPQPLNRFTSFDWKLGAAGYMDLPQVREALLSLLGKLDPEVWYDFDDFVQFLKKDHYPLILDHKRRDRYNKANFYHSFEEYQSPEGRYSRDPSLRREIHDKLPDAFERVEGRYLAYFLENLPFLLGYVSLAKLPPEDVWEAFPFPEYRTLRGFCLTPKGKAVLSGNASYPFRRELKLLPNFDIHLHMPDFSEKILGRLTRISPLRREGPVYSGKLSREMICQVLLQGERLEDYLTFFRGMGSLPQNVEVELRSWAGHIERVVIYAGGVYLESLADRERIRQEGEIAPAIVGEPPGGLILREGERVLDRLIEKGYAPLAKRAVQPEVRPISEEKWLLPFSGRDPWLLQILSKIAEKTGETAEGEVYRLVPEKLDRCDLPRETLLAFWQKYLPIPSRGPWRRLFPQPQEEKKGAKGRSAARSLKMTPYLKVELPDPETCERLKAYLTQKGMEFIAIDRSSIFVSAEAKAVIAKGEWC
ncbi:MAG: hypothetical protein HYY20_10950 [Candidatus Tectomicrobia bacterium]|uniref:Helicase XPB/Ssl2 N-terminal domain-containing protein n=1 Tax=Tectimicrobiota bacterium TaxID=2528274 RepID=A0A932CQ87_UNCTE|nr:hypothetical protein [Candidatus Tectomicrobia bacterium]